MAETYVDRMRKEYTELVDRMKKGMTFIASDKGKDLDINEQVLLTQQLNAMQLYAYILGMRLRLAESKEKEEK